MIKSKHIKKIVIEIATLLFSVFMLCSCFGAPDDNNKTYVIPEKSITYISFQKGNVIDEGKRAIYFNFRSDYAVVKIEIVGNLLDKDENIIYTFDTNMSFGVQSKNPEVVVRADKDIVQGTYSVSFIKIKGYTTEETR